MALYNPQVVTRLSHSRGSVQSPTTEGFFPYAMWMPSLLPLSEEDQKLIHNLWIRWERFAIILCHIIEKTESTESGGRNMPSFSYVKIFFKKPYIVLQWVLEARYNHRGFWRPATQRVLQTRYTEGVAGPLQRGCWRPTTQRVLETYYTEGVWGPLHRWCCWPATNYNHLQYTSATRSWWWWWWYGSDDDDDDDTENEPGTWSILMQPTACSMAYIGNDLGLPVLLLVEGLAETQCLQQCPQVPHVTCLSLDQLI